MPISHYGRSIQVTATSTSVAYALPDGHQRYEVVNRGGSNVYVAFGGASIAATVPDATPAPVQLVPPGAVLAGDLQAGQGYVAVLSEAGTSRVIIQMGA